MKKRFLSFILSVFMLCGACFVFSACINKTSSEEPEQESSESWINEEIEDQEHGEIELPEVERP